MTMRLPGDTEPQRLKGGNRPEQAFLDGDIRQSDQMDADARRNIHFHGDGHGLDADTLCAQYFYNHLFCAKMRHKKTKKGQKKKNFFVFVNLQLLFLSVSV